MRIFPRLLDLVRVAISRLARILLSPEKADNLVENVRFLRAWPTLKVERLIGSPRKIIFEKPKDFVRLNELRVAAIIDNFTKENLEKEVNLANLVKGNALAQLDSHRPHILFVESAWNGEDGSWKGLLVSRNDELRKIIAWCRQRDIPTVFWNKEDPVHWKSYIFAASLFDFIYTTDSNSVSDYKKFVSSHVGIMPFFISTKIFNPFDEELRQKKSFFAGSYYKQYPKRQRDLNRILGEIQPSFPFEIFDRNLKSGENKNPFPSSLEEYVNPAVSYSEVRKCYKKYQVCITVNTVTKSPTMFARRVLEAAASNCLVVSNHSYAIEKIFGDAVLISKENGDLRKYLNSHTSKPLALQEKRISALTITLEHLTTTRVISDLMEDVFTTEPSDVNTDEINQDLPNFQQCCDKSCLQESYSSHGRKQKEFDIQPRGGTSDLGTLEAALLSALDQVFKNYVDVKKISILLQDTRGQNVRLISTHRCLARKNSTAMTISLER